MIKIIVKRVLQLIPVLLITMSITFVITRVIPGNPAVSILGPQATAEDIAKMEERMGLNDPLPVQYINYIAGVFTGDLGTSYRYNQPVAGLILEKLPNTLVLALSSLVIALIIGVPVGILSVVNSFRVYREAYLLAGSYPDSSIYLIPHLFAHWFLSLDIQKMTAASVMMTGMFLMPAVAVWIFYRRK